MMYFFKSVLMSKLTVRLVVLLMLPASQAAAAERLLNYENRIVRAAEQIERIKADKEYGEEGISYVKRLLPASEQIEIANTTVTVDNRWLHDLLDSYAAEKDPQQGLARLNEAAGRLRALDDHLRRAEASSGEESAREKIREILSRPEYQPAQETVIGAHIKRALKKVREVVGAIYSALTSALEKLFGASAYSGWVSQLLLVVVLAAAVIVIVRVSRRLRVPKAQRRKTRIVLGEEVAADGTSGQLAEAGLAAARAGDFRTGIRKLYVSLLFELGELNLIELDESATNHEYLKKVIRFSGLAAPMRYLTDRFDYVWYGMFSSTQEDFAVYLARYDEAMKHARALSEHPANSR